MIPRTTFRTASQLASAALLAACSPQSDAGAPVDGKRVVLASDAPPIPAAPVQPEGALWQAGPGGSLEFGVAGAAALLAIECRGEPGKSAFIHFKRRTRAEEGAKALMAIEGNGHVARVPISVTLVGDPGEWQGDYDAMSEFIEALKGDREVAVTLPGGGQLKLPPSPLPGQLLDACRATMPKAAITPAAASQPNEAPEG